VFLEKFMRVDFNHGAQPPSETGTSGTPNSEARNTVPVSGNFGEDEAQLSETHAQAGDLAAQASQLPEVRLERVSSLRQAVLSGQYQASSKNVAGAVFDHMLAGAFA
jgi:flagellar biosynthesis anti-sigma factor FlgM